MEFPGFDVEKGLGVHATNAPQAVARPTPSARKDTDRSATHKPNLSRQSLESQNLVRETPIARPGREDVLQPKTTHEPITANQTLIPTARTEQPTHEPDPTSEDYEAHPAIPEQATGEGVPAQFRLFGQSEELTLPGPFRNKSYTSSTSTLAAEKSSSINYLELPTKKHGWIHRNLRYTLFSVYRRLSVLVILANSAVIVVLGGSGRLLDAQVLATAAAANILAAVLIRQELVINLLFATFGKCPHWLPLRIRRLAAKVYHLGGVHSGAGIAATVWFALFNVPIVRAWKAESHLDRGIDLAVLIITIVLDILLVGIVSMSHPCVRSRFHNTWEVIHRFVGWTSVGLFWALTILTSDAQRRNSIPPQLLSAVLVRSPVFWCLFVVTVALILPWLRLQKVPVRAEYLSEHAIRLHLGYTNLPLCAAPRFSDSPLKEWHAFAGIPEPDGVGFSILVSRAGDWTKRMIENPPKELWTRGIPARGVLHLAPIFKKLVLVATGSGIGPILGLLHARNLNARIIWSTPDPFQTYSSSIVEQIQQADPEALIINTSKSGRPDLVQEAYKLYRSSEAEAVFVISNPKVTRKVVYGLESRGIPAFAPIFDS